MGVCKGVCALLFILFHLASLRATETVGGKVVKLSSHRRESRSLFDSSQTPAPVDCRLSEWSEWSPCFPCQEKRYRFRSLQQPSKFEGRLCAGYLWDEIICKATEKCVPQNKCGLDFQCAETGRCINRQMVCNGEPDCRDASDEKDCNPSMHETFCNQLFPIPGSEKAVIGFNVLTQEEVHNLYDPNFFGGQCDYVYNGEWREMRYDPACEQLYYAADEKYFRKPYNFHVYKFLAHADTGLSFEIYEDSRDLLNAIKKENSHSFGLTFGISAADSPVGLEVGYSTASKRGFLKNITSYNQKNVEFMRIVTKVQTARFRMRRKSVVLDEDMLQSLMELPDKYNYGLYAKFINDYGTHFITSGTMGGTFENILVLDKDIMRKKEISSSMISSCFGTSVGISLKSEDGLTEGKLSLSEQNCNKAETVFQDPTSSESVIKDIITHIRGGDTVSIGGLLNIFSGNTYRFWGRSLKYNPAVIDFELQPMYEILRRTNLPETEAKGQNLKRALEEFLSEFNACRCGPCQNNGEPILNGNVCICQCPTGFEGPACERTLRKGNQADGSWSCWTSWTNCHSGKRQRTRDCNNPAPKNGGTWCSGKNVQYESC
ncbi:hypothetical protein FKM82_001937 [Ascaphus truei]